MRKRTTNPDPQNVAPVDQSWLELQRLAQVELTSEDAAYPIEAAPQILYAVISRTLKDGYDRPSQ